MADDDNDYAPVGYYDDEDELLKNGGYAPAVPAPAADQPPSAASMSASPYPAPQPVFPPLGSTGDLEARAADRYSPYAAPLIPAPPPGPGSTEDLETRAAAIPAMMGSAMSTPQPQRPQWKDYAPAEVHGWGKVGRVLGDLFTGEPRRDLERRQLNYQNATADYEAPQVEAARDAETDQKTATADKDRAEAFKATHPQPKEGLTPEETTIHDLMTGENGGPRVNPGTGKPYSYLDAYTAVAQAKQDTKPTPGMNQEQNKLAFQGVVGKLDAAGLSTDPKTIDKSLDAALKKGAITPEEHSAARAYQAANPTPGTNLQVHIDSAEDAGARAINKMFEGKDVIAHMPDGSRMQMSYADAKAQKIPPERLVALSEKESQENQDKQSSTASTFTAIDQYRKNLKNNADKLTGDDKHALEVLTSRVHSDPGFAGKLGDNLMDVVFAAGGKAPPLSGYTEKVMDGIMTKAQYDALSTPGRQLLADYFTANMANFANAKHTLGSLPRNPAEIQFMVSQVPLPYLGWDAAAPIFENYRGELMRRTASIPQMYAPPKK